MPDVRLRPWRLEDADEIAEMLDDEHVRRWSSMTADLTAWIERQRSGQRGPSLAICQGDDDRPLGKIALRMPGKASPATTCEAVSAGDAPVGELSYWVIPEARGLGLARCAVTQMLGWIAGNTELASVVLDIDVTNIASARLAQKLGAERRWPERVQPDRTGTPRTLAVFVLRIPGR